MQLVLSKLKLVFICLLVMVPVVALCYKVYEHFYPASYFDRAFKCQESGQLTDALKYYVKEVERDPECSAAYNNMGVIYSELGNIKEAEESFNKAKEVSSKSLTNRRHLGKTKVLSSEFEGAIEDLSVALSIDPSDELSLRLRGYSFLRSGKPARAIEDFSEAIKLDPAASVNYAFRGRAYVMVKQKDKAYKDFSQAIKLDPQDKESYARRAAISAAKGYSKSIEDCLKLLEFKS